MGSWKFVAPGAVGKAVEVSWPVFLETPLPTGSALLAIWSVYWVASQNADLALVLALVTRNGRLKDLSWAFLTAAEGKGAVKLLIHADLQQPVLNFLLLSFRNEVLHGHVDVVRRRNVWDSEFIILRDIVVVGIIDDFVDVEVSIEQNWC